jgi:hypothetical protein
MANDVIDNFITTINFLFFDMLLLTLSNRFRVWLLEVLRAAHVLVREIKSGGRHRGNGCLHERSHRAVAVVFDEERPLAGGLEFGGREVLGKAQGPLTTS